ncbi:MAG: hypothetical protein M1822_008418 [Bathelium mastoideum]|nr:MAG: hypothetical protein M1822_008418 [Bathelium mastoideum]
MAAELSIPSNRASHRMPGAVTATEFPQLPRPQPHPSINEHTRVHVLAPLVNEQQSGSDVATVERYANELSLGDLTQQSPEHPLRWDVGNDPVSHLDLPTRRSHSGKFDWIGKESEALPTYLWDSQTFETVSATPEILNQGYIAVSWTWGRYQETDGKRGVTRKSKGTPWEVPRIWPDAKQDLLHRRYDVVHHLKACLASIPKHRYFWVDIFCINQQEESEKQREIKKQANIFGSAQGVIVYLWNLDKSALLVDPIAGLGELLSWTVVFGNGRTYRDRLTKCYARKRVSFLDRFESLREERWFTSLWALQEIVLAPAGVWMTRYGDFCHLNNHVLTTRKMAIIVRLLSWAAKRREQVWLDAYQSYMKSKEWTKEDFERFLGKYKSQDNQTKEELSQEVQNKLRTYQSKHLSVPMSRSSSSSSNRGTSPSTSMISLSSLRGKSTFSSDDSGDQGIVVEITKAIEDPPWLITRYNDEALLRAEISKWKTWAFGGACIDVALTATRAGILVAGRNRNVVKGNSREQALFAALKVQPDDRFVSPATDHDSPHLSPFLINIILKAEGPKLFDVEHGSPRQRATKSNRNDFDVTEWEEPDTQVDYILVEDVKMGTMITKKCDFPEMKAKYKQRGLEKFARVLPGHPSLLSDMFPDTASRINPQILPFSWEGMYSWAKSDTWHMHAGALHVPEEALIQKSAQRRQVSRFSTWVRPNGSEDEPYEVRSWSDLKLVCRTQYRLLALLGSSDSDMPNFLFLPLAIRNGRCASHEDWDCHSDALINRPGIIGVVLVTKSKNPSESMTVWHKFGTYATDSLVSESLRWGNGEIFQKLGWKDGILVSAFPEQSSLKSQQAGFFDCRKHRHQLNEFIENFRRRSTDEPEYEIVHHHDVVDFPRVGSPASQPYRRNLRRPS